MNIGTKKMLQAILLTVILVAGIWANVQLAYPVWVKILLVGFLIVACILSYRNYARKLDREQA
ncbi:hypothetical protein [Paenibacillus tengchongensis]|uniref:hypothetical protein n=1 Tax=Paenibacillus tengchongensis TaxID=2608684 RepID=UPI00124E665A|nr:hypothetical protein [Paenibacillus tengchongensis]